MLELEEERDKLKDEMASSKSFPPLSLVTTPGHPGHLVTDDSGCNSSVSTEGAAADILELTYQDFRKEKVADTKAKLQVKKGSKGYLQDDHGGLRPGLRCLTVFAKVPGCHSTAQAA